MVKTTDTLAAARQAAEFARMERETERAAKARQARRLAVVHSADVVFSELAADPAALAKAAYKARATGHLEAAKAKAEAARQMGISVSELSEQLRLEELLRPGRDETLKDAKDVGYASTLTLAQLAEVKAAAKAMHDSPVAKAGRVALDAMGPTAAALVLTNTKAGRLTKLTVAKVTGVPNVDAAEAKVSKLTARLAEAREHLAEAEAAEAKTAKTDTKQARRLAEAKADKVAAVVGRLAAQLAKAEAGLEAAKAAAERPEAGGLIWQPVAHIRPDMAAKAGTLDLPVRRDRMPSKFVERGPSAKTGPRLNDNTAAEALANIEALTEEQEKQAWLDFWAEVRDLLAAKAEAEAAAKAEARAASIAQKRLNEKLSRRAAKLANR